MISTYNENLAVSLHAWPAPPLKEVADMQAYLVKPDPLCDCEGLASECDTARPIIIIKLIKIGIATACISKIIPV